MIPSAFEYVRVGSVDDAVSALAKAGDSGKIIAGGQSLLPLLRMRLASPELLIDISEVDELIGVCEEGDSLIIGAATTHHEVATNALVAKFAPLLAETAKTVADPAIRHRGTFGGSLAHADPAADLPAAVLVLNAEMRVAGPKGRRTIPAGEFFTDYLTSSLAEDEILVSIAVKKATDGWGFHYEKFQRTAQAWGIVTVAAAVHVSGGKIVEARVGLGNMGSTPVRATAAEQALTGANADANSIAAAAELAAEGTHPTSDISAASDYRKHLARVLTKRAVAKAAGVAL